MNTDFFNAYQRHAADADLLMENRRWANADHLYGLAAECGIKALIMSFEAFSNSVDLPKEYRVHINKLWALSRTTLDPGGESIFNENPFADWDVAQRYANENDIPETTAQKHCAAFLTLKKFILYYMNRENA